MHLFLKTPFWLPLIYPSLEWKIDDQQNNIYLTFDDGPIPEVTPLVLEILRSYGVKATFFCVGENIKKHPEIFRLLLADGHAVGNHTFNHIKGWDTSIADYILNIEKCDDAIKAAGGNSKLFRPPYGKIKPGAIKKIKNDYRIIMWDVLTADYDPGFDKELCLKKSISNTEAGSIAVFHDNIKALEKVSYVLPKYINHFLNQGFHFKTL